MTAMLAQEWVRKAAEDWEAIRRLRAGGEADVVTDVIGFLAQQTAEKYLKACLALARQSQCPAPRGAGAALPSCTGAVS